MYYINCFWIYSVIGYLLETINFKIRGQKDNSGILYGPWTFIYGIGSIIILLISKFTNQFNYNIFIEIIINFVYCFLILTLIELIAGNLIEIIFKKVWWNYTNHKYNIGKYIALDVSIIWGILSILFIYIIRPIIDKLITIIPNIIPIVIIILMIIDFAIVIINKSKIKKVNF